MARQPSECSDKGKSEATEGLTGTIGLTGSPTLYIVKRDYLEAGKNRKVKGTWASRTGLQSPISPETGRLWWEKMGWWPEPLFSSPTLIRHHHLCSAFSCNLSPVSRQLRESGRTDSPDTSWQTRNMRPIEQQWFVLGGPVRWWQKKVKSLAFCSFY